jgi:nucleoside-diphosphate-sugar epimerase
VKNLHFTWCVVQLGLYLADYCPEFEVRKEWIIMKSIDAVFVTGANGLLGAGIVSKLIERADPAVRIIAIVRSEKAERELRQILAGSAFRVEIMIVDWSNGNGAMDLLPPGALNGAVLVHCAADVSWDKSEADLTPANVEATRTAAQFITRAAQKPAFVYISSAYTRMENWEYRNGYEASKAAAERLLRTEFPALPLSVFSCSLIIGSSADGAISRFHGLYPLMRLVSTPGTPFLIGRDDCLIDLVPIDWVADQLFETVRRAMLGETLDVVASSGGGAVRLDRMFRLIETEINRFRVSHGFTARAELPILSYRRWDFLKRSIEAWKPPGLSTRELRQLIQLVDIYRPYTMSDLVRAPASVTQAAPSGESLLPTSVIYWLEQHSEQIIGRWRRAADGAAE